MKTVAPFCAPVLFLVYNRPTMARQVFQQIRQAQPARLYVAADGPRSDRPDDEALCQETRAIAAEVDWPCQVNVLFRSANMGCKLAISSALDWFFQQEEAGIILEDDCVPAMSFFRICAQLLETYRDDCRIMSIGGSNPISELYKCEGDYTFSRFFNIWGWATWRRVWMRVDMSMADWPRLKQTQAIRALYSHEGMIKWISSLFDKAYANNLDTWDVQFFYSCLFNNGLSVVPRHNLITNIGFQGHHASALKECRNLMVPVAEMDQETIRHPKHICPDYQYDHCFMQTNFPVAPKNGQKAAGRRGIKLLLEWLQRRKIQAGGGQ